MEMKKENYKINEGTRDERPAVLLTDWHKLLLDCLSDLRWSASPGWGEVPQEREDDPVVCGLQLVLMRRASRNPNWDKWPQGRMDLEEMDINRCYPSDAMFKV